MPVPVTRAIQDSISNLYISILGRNPDPAGFSYWVDQLANQNNTPQALTSITLNFSNAPEFKATYGSLTTDAAVALMYRNVLNRDADAPGLAYWAQQATNYINAGYTVSQAYALTGNALIVGAANNAGTADSTLIIGKQTAAVTAGNATPVTTYTLSTAAPETITATGLNNVINGTQATLNANDTIIGSINGSTTLSIVDTGTAAFNPTAASITNVQTVALRNINGIAAVAAVTAVNEQQTSTLTGTAVGGGATTTVSFLGVASASVATGAVASTVAAAITTAKAAILAGTEAATLGLIDISNTGAVLTLTFSSAKGNVANIFSPVNAGITFSAGTQTVQGVAGVPAVNAATFTDTVNANLFAGATLFVNETSTSQVDFTNLAATQAIRINGNGLTNLANTNATWSTATSATLNINGGTAFTGGTGVVTLAGNLATVTINSTGTATGTSATAALGANVVNGIALGSAATTVNINASNNLVTGGLTQLAGTTATINVTGSAGLVNLGILEANTVGTVNAGTFAGGITATLNNNVALAFTGGAGNDTITTGAVLTTGSVNAGGGTGDILIAGNIAHINTAALAAKYTGFETLRVGSSTVDASLIAGITRVQLTAAVNTVANLSASQTVQAFNTGALNIGANTFSPVSGTTNTLNLILGAGTTTLAAVDADILTTTGFQTLNLTANPGPTSAVGAARISTITGAIVDANLTTVNLSGSSFVFTDIASTLATTWNGSALVGSGSLVANAITGLTIAGNATAGSSFIGSNVSDQFTLGTAVASTYNGGGGNDTFIGTVAQLGTGTATNPVLVGGTGTDTLSITDAAATLDDTNFKSVSGFEALNLATTTGAISVTGLTTNANAAFATGLTVTSGALVNGSTYAFNTLAYSSNVTLTLVTDGDLASTADNVTIVTGTGNDTVSVAGALAVFAAGAGGTISVTTGAGVDTITVSTGTITANTNNSVVITAGTGADIINVTTHVNAGAIALGSGIRFTMAVGDSTTTAFDAVTGFKMGDIAGTGGLASDTLDFASVALNAYAATAASGLSAAELTVAVSSTGIVTFGGTTASTLTLAQKIAAVQSVVTVVAGDTALFLDTAGGVTSSYVFNNNSSGDSLVQLVGISGGALQTTNTTTVDNGIHIN